MKHTIPTQTTKTGPRIRSPKRGVKRVALGLRVSADVKRQLDRLATEQSVSLSKATEDLISEALSLKKVLAALVESNQALLTDKRIESLLQTAQWTIVDTPRGKAYLRPADLTFEKPALTLNETKP
jgi:hypothetical protein